MQRIAIIFSLLFLLGYSEAQLHEAVFPDLEGEPLLVALNDAYRPDSTFSYADARDTLWGKILKKNDSLSCFYTSYTIYLDPLLSPRQDAFDKGINAEHMWPRSKGASGPPAESDMHHLVPTRIGVNSDRGNLPFGDVPISQTSFWYYQDIKRGNAPPLNERDLYSRIGNGMFTPPVHRKGDVARSMFYFYTVYKLVSDLEDPEFFDIQREAFCRWHFEDPVDQEEWDKTQMIGAYQQGKVNPFVVDCTLPERSYCSDMPLRCDISLSTNIPEIEGFYTKIFPNPASPTSQIQVTIPNRADISLKIYNSLGQMVGLGSHLNMPSGTFNTPLQGMIHSELTVSGVYYMVIQVSENTRHYNHVERFVIP